MSYGRALVYQNGPRLDVETDHKKDKKLKRLSAGLDIEYGLKFE